MSEFNLKEEIFSFEEDILPLFDLDLKSLIEQKAKGLTELRNLEMYLLFSKQSVSWDRANMLLSTDFKRLCSAEEEMRKAYLTKKLYDEACEIELDEKTIEYKKDRIGIIDLIIQLRFKGEW